MRKKLIILFLLVCLLFPYKTNATANTLADLKNELASLKAQKAANDSAKKKTQSEINTENSKIADAYSNIEQSESDIEVAKTKITETQEAIEKAKSESAKLLEFYQIVNGDNSTLEFISGASTMTDLIMRTDSVKEILAYNDTKLAEFESLIEEQNALQITLAKKEEELQANIKTYESELASLNNDMSVLSDASLDISAQIKAQQELIAYYENAGCKDSDLLSSCIKVNDTVNFMRPLERGYISSRFGYRTYTVNGVKKTDFHNAKDIAGNAMGTKVYAIANGTVAAIINKSSCGGNQVILHVRVKGQAYTVLYAHLLSINVKVGDKVTQSTVIGTVGGGGSTLKKNGGWDTCSTGAHLHMSIATGFYLGGGSEGYSSYSTFVSRCFSAPFLPEYGNWFYSRYV